MSKNISSLRIQLLIFLKGHIAAKNSLEKTYPVKLSASFDFNYEEMNE